ncbi:hypothetical protein [Streptantibioticus cattleyicolor]|nr:hypothetical protein [Streptantibioticus cattleyicolor]CCB72605.1 exported protein of unknown function [Streptantibioticus cattleyicolor NRRL 8057 = DSM 46488]
MAGKKLASRLGVVAATVGLAVGAVAGTAEARSDNISTWYSGRCNTVNWFCLYYSPDASGASLGYPHADADIHDLGNYRYANDGAGAGQVVRNNAASAEDVSNCNVGIWYSTDFTGDSEWLSPWMGGNLTFLRNNEASISVDDNTHCPGTGMG